MTDTTKSAFTIRAVAMFAIAVMLLSACTSSSSTAQDPVTETAQAETPVVETPTEVPTPTPTEVPTPEPEPLSDADMIDVARAAFDADPRPGELIAWDHLDATAFGDRVRLEICSWTGDTVFDDLRIVEYEIDANGTASYIFDGSTPGDCLNTELVDSALAFTRDFDTYWSSVLEDPTTFDPEVDRQFTEASRLDDSIELVAGWVSDEAYWEGDAFDSGLPDSSLQPVAWRRFERGVLTGEVLELISCRELATNYGLYRNGVLIDDQKGPNASGTNVIHKYQLSRAGDSWVVGAITTTGWADCFATEWLQGLNNWQPDPTEWQLLQ